MAYLGLGATPEIRDVPPDGAEAADAWARLTALIAGYADGAHGYLARQRPDFLSYASDYDHLSRHGEWEDGDDPEEMEVGR